jgi:diketogulonate reductase-like aldo/keto reductase
MNDNQPTISLNDGHLMPQIGFGVFLVPEDETYDAVTYALKSGYRSIDTAALYGNEVPTGRAIADSGIARDDLLVTTKVWNDDQGYDSTLRAFDASLGRLGLEYLDLYLIHWPTPKRDRYADTWRALETLQSDGRVRSIGVSNFQIPHLQRIIDEYEVVPAVNQVELHPELTQRSLRAFHAEHGIATEAWSPLARGGLLDDPTIAGIAAALRRTPAQVHPALAPSARQRGDSQVSDAGPDRGERRHSRLRPLRRPTGPDLGSGQEPAGRSGP